MRVSKFKADCFVQAKLEEWGLSHFSWKWKNIESYYGSASVGTDEIVLNLELLKSKKKLEWVVLHEICHCLDYNERGTFLNEKGKNDFHGKNFKKWCSIVGVSYSRLID